MIAVLFHFFSASGFMPHGHCYLWRPEIVATHVISDAIIAISYWSIPFSLYYVMRRRRDVPVRWLIGLFVVFIAACGVTHAMEVLTVWHPLYITSGLIKVFTAVVSALTAIALVPILPRLVSLRSPQELEALNAKLSREVQERLAVERELRQSHATLEAIVNASPLSIFAVDKGGRVTLWNPAAETLFGWSAAEAKGHAPPHIPQTERPEFQRMLEQELQGAAFRQFEAPRQTRSGQIVEVAGWTAPLKVDGDIVGGLHILGDITERKQLERERAQLAELLEARVAERTTELEQANQELTVRNRENEIFVYSVSHDLRSPLVNLQGFSQELRQSCNEIGEILADPQVPDPLRERGTAILNGDVNEAIHYIQTAVTRLSDILMALLRLSRAGRAEYNREPLDMQQLLADVIAAQDAELRSRGATISIDVHTRAMGDHSAIAQVFSQFLSNALHYSRPEMPPQIQIGELPHADGASSHMDGGRYMTYYVRDNGLGIAAGLHAKVFQAFQRLHPNVATGDGIGLALARRIVERHRGKIWFESTPDIGSTFYVSLPTHAADAPKTD